MNVTQPSIEDCLLVVGVPSVDSKFSSVLFVEKFQPSQIYSLILFLV